ncbi:uncharacterized protein LOC113366677 [Ctenocephalides felis]|uniref:uncharacterized protein LOC113366677 n=1 Tax=Ctenocephalides felis TaxID=7515 RepID=UPI000E6E2345|nr:uncharacterized protein LOC113366677 [Ctenocephalides felis]
MNVQPEDAGSYLCSSTTAYGVPYSQQYDLHVEEYDSRYPDASRPHGGSQEQHERHQPYDSREHDHVTSRGGFGDSQGRSSEDHSGAPSDLHGRPTSSHMMLDIINLTKDTTNQTTTIPTIPKKTINHQLITKRNTITKDLVITNTRDQYMCHLPKLVKA